MMRFLLIILLLSLSTLCAQPVVEIIHRFETDMERPTDLTVLDDGRICVADGVNNRVLVFQTNGRFSELKLPGMKRPLGLAGTLNGGLLITDTEADMIFILDRNLKLKGSISLAPEIDATDVLEIDKNVLWVVDNDNHQILVMNHQGQVTEKVGRKGSAGPTFNYPSTLSMGKNNQVYVCDVLNGRIQLFDIDGTYRGQIADWGITPGSLFRPKGVAANSKGSFVVSDSFTGILHFFRSQSSAGSVLLIEASKPFRLKNPLGVDWGSDGLLWVVESATGDVLGIRLP